MASLLGLLCKAAAFLVVVALAGHFLFRRLLLCVDRTAFTRRYPEITFIFAMMLAFLYGMGAELVGLSAIVGAFVAGASFAGTTLQNGRDLHQGSESPMIIFSSIFFVSLGILADVRSLDCRILLFVVTLTVVAFLSKMVGCGGAALLCGDSVRHSAIIGFGMAPRGEVAMIVGLVRLDRGYIGQSVYLSVILMSLLTTVATPFVLRSRLFPPSAQRPRQTP